MEQSTSARWSVSGIALAAICALALGLRLHRIDADLLWWDEGISIFLAHEPIARLTVAKDFALDLHPPVYHLLLGGWRTFAGASVFASRYLSALIGVATVPLAFQIGRAIGGPVAGLLAALLLAVSPFHLHHSQEVRMYPLVALLGAVYILATLRGLDGRLRLATRSRAAAVAGLVFGLGLYTYYYLAFLPVALVPGMVVGWREAGRAMIARIAAWHAVGVALFLPWLATLLRQYQSGTTFTVPPEMATPRSLADFLTEIARVLAAGYASPPDVATMVAIGSIAAMVIAVLTGAGGRGARWHALGLVIGPVALAFISTQLRPFFYPRFVIFTLPSALALVGTGIASLARFSRPVGVIGAVALVAALSPALQGYYAGGRYAFAGTDALMQIETLGELGRSGDVVLVAYAWQAGYVRSYLPRHEFVFAYDPDPDPSTVASLLDQHGRVWVLSHSPDGTWIGLRGEDAPAEAGGISSFTRDRGTARIRLFRLPAQPPLARERPARAQVGDSFNLIDATVTSPGEGLAPGTQLRVELTWQAIQPSSRALTVFMQLLGPDGSIVAQQDNPPLRGTRPTTTFAEGEMLVDPYVLQLPQALAPGRYTLQTGLYHAESGEREPVIADGERTDSVILAVFDVKS